MKNLLIVPLLFLCITVWGQSEPIKVVFDVTSQDKETHQAVLRHVNYMADAYPQSEFAVVVYGGALPMMMKGKSSVENEILKFKDSPNVSFLVCEGTIERFSADPKQLIAGVKTVPDGILEIVRKQSKGWGYIKEAHK